MNTKYLNNKLDFIASELKGHNISIFDLVIGVVGECLAEDLTNKVKEIYNLDEVNKIELREINKKAYLFVC